MLAWLGYPQKVRSQQMDLEHFPRGFPESQSLSHWKSNSKMILGRNLKQDQLMVGGVKKKKGK